VANEKISNLEGQITNNELKIADLNTEVSNLNTEKENYSTTINELKSENEALKEFKEGIENRAKQSLVEKYSAVLNEDQIAKYTDEAIKNYTIADLEKDLSLDYVNNNNASIFSKQEPEPTIPVEHNPVGIERLLDKYEHKN
jgi:FtsZ-binding cell division protein ZapB